VNGSRILMAEASTANNESQLWVMAAVAFAVVYSNYMVAPLVPALSRQFSVTAYQLGWLIPGFLIPYGMSTLVYGALSDRWGRTPMLVTLLCFAATTMVTVSFAMSWRTLLIARILSGVGCGGIVTISLAAVGDRYPYAVQGRPMGRMFGAIAAGIGFGSTLGPILNPLIGWRNEFRARARMRVFPCGRVPREERQIGYRSDQQTEFLRSGDSRIPGRAGGSAWRTNHGFHFLQRSVPWWNFCLA
jgi:predicted MFS family arabinose efflux permease